MVSGSPFGRVGGTTFWSDNPQFSAMTFGSRKAVSDVIRTSDMVPQGAANVLRKDFRKRGIAIICWQYRRSWFGDRWVGNVPILEVNCATSSASQRPQFFASFKGREDATATFYQAVAKVMPTE